MAAFITETELESYIGYELDSGKAALALNGASTVVRKESGQVLDAGEGTILLDGTGTDTVVMPEWPVAVSKVLITGETIEGAEYAPIEPPVSLSVAGLLRRTDRGIFHEGRANVEVTYSYGFASIPEDLKLVALTVATRVYQQGIVKTTTVGMTQVEFSSDSLTLTAGEMAICKRYKRYRPDYAVTS